MSNGIILIIFGILNIITIRKYLSQFMNKDDDIEVLFFQKIPLDKIFLIQSLTISSLIFIVMGIAIL